MDGVARGTLINLATRLLGVGLMLAITAMVARIGADVQGRFALFTSVEGVLLALGSGFGIALARRVSHHGEPPQPLVGATVGACVVLGLLAAAPVAALATWGPASYADLAWLALAAPLLLVAPNLNGLWLGQGRMGPMAVLALTAPALALSALLLMHAAGHPVALPDVLAAWVGAKVVLALGVLLAVWRRPGWSRPTRRTLQGDLSFVTTIALTNLVGLLNYRAGLFVVERQLGLTATGVYSVAVIVAELLWFVSGSLTQAVYGRIGTPDRAHAADTTLRVVQAGVLALVVAAPLLWLAAWLLLPLVLGPAYAASLLPLLLLLPGVLLFGGASALSAYFTNHAGAPQVPARVALVSLALHGGLALVLVPALGVAGAAVAASVAYTAGVVLLARRFAQHVGWPWRRLLQPHPRLLADLRGVASRSGGSR